MSTEPELALASDEDGDIESDENDPNAEFRRALRTALGDWYVIHSYAGYEKKVKGNLQTRIQSLNMEDYIFQIEVPKKRLKNSRTVNSRWLIQHLSGLCFSSHGPNR